MSQTTLNYFDRVYTGTSHEDLQTLKSCHLIDEFKMALKSFQNYKDAALHILQFVPELKQCLEKFALPFPGDWPTWFYTNKNIAQETNLSSHFLSLILEQGPFHVSLNAQEDVGKLYNFFLDVFYKDLFGSALPKKLKPHQIQFLLMVMFFWLATYKREDYEEIPVVQRY